MSAESTPQETQRFVESAGVRLSVREQGDPADPTVVLVHGYPDNSSVWDEVVDELAGADAPWHVVRYDVRGMGRSSAPEGPGGYRMEHLAADLAAVVRAVSPDAPVHLVAHDWGSIQTWEAVSDPRYQYLFASFTSLSGPCLDHLAAWRRRNLRSPRGLLTLLNQGLHSGYIAFFRTRRLPELAWGSRALRARFAAEYDDAVRGLELYRQNMAGRAPNPRVTPVPVQQLVLSGDAYVRPALATAADPWCSKLWRRPLKSGHWAPREQPAPVSRVITEFVAHLDDPSAAPELKAARVRGGE